MDRHSAKGFDLLPFPGPKELGVRMTNRGKLPLYKSLEAEDRSDTKQCSRTAMIG